MTLALFATMVVVGGILSGWMAGAWSATVSPVMTSLVTTLVPFPALATAILWAIDGGLIAMLTIGIPYVLTFYVLVAALEDSGYLTSAAVLMDRVFNVLGLPGRTAVPLLTAAGCNVPGIYGTRILATRRERLLGAFLVTLTPCSARSAVVIAALAPFAGPLVALAAFILVAVITFGTSLAANAIVPGRQPALVLELAPLRRPIVRHVGVKAWSRFRAFVVMATPIMLAGSFVLGLVYESGLWVQLAAVLGPITETLLGLPAIAGVAIIFAFLRKELALQLLLALAIVQYGAGRRITRRLPVERPAVRLRDRGLDLGPVRRHACDARRRVRLATGAGDGRCHPGHRAGHGDGPRTRPRDRARLRVGRPRSRGSGAQLDAPRTRDPPATRPGHRYHPRMRTERIPVAEGVELAVDRSASAPAQPTGPAFLLVHGLASNARMWDGVAEDLVAERHAVATVDLRGHGRSSKPEGPYDVPTVADDVAVLIEALGLDRPVVAGQSWGGNVAVELAARHPTSIRGIVCVDGGWLEPSRAFPDWETCREILSPPRLKGRPFVEVEAYVRSAHHDWPEAGIRGALANFEVRPDGTIAPWLTFDRHIAVLRGLWDHHPSERYAALTVPVLLLPVEGDQGDADATRRKHDDIEAAAGAIPKVRVCWFTGDHDIHAQRPDERGRGDARRDH